MKYPWMIICDGIDCSGKTTFIKEFNKATNYSSWIIDRSTISVTAYANKFNRNIPDFSRLENFLNTWPFILVIRFIASKEDTVKRQNRKNDGYDSSDYEIDMELFDKAEFESGFTKIVVLNSSKMSLVNEIEKVINYINQVEKSYDATRTLRKNF